MNTILRPAVLSFVFLATACGGSSTTLTPLDTGPKPDADAASDAPSDAPGDSVVTDGTPADSPDGAGDAPGDVPAETPDAD